MPKREIDLLMRLLERFLVEERPRLMQNGVKLVHVGRRERLGGSVLQKLDETVALTASNQGMRLGLAISYGGRAAYAYALRFSSGKPARRGWRGPGRLRQLPD